MWLGACKHAHHVTDSWVIFCDASGVTLIHLQLILLDLKPSLRLGLQFSDRIPVQHAQKPWSLFPAPAQNFFSIDLMKKYFYDLQIHKGKATKRHCLNSNIILVTRLKWAFVTIKWMYVYILYQLEWLLTLSDCSLLYGWR